MPVISSCLSFHFFLSCSYKLKVNAARETYGLGMGLTCAAGRHSLCVCSLIDKSLPSSCQTLVPDMEIRGRSQSLRTDSSAYSANCVIMLTQRAIISMCWMRDVCDCNPCPVCRVSSFASERRRLNHPFARLPLLTHTHTQSQSVAATVVVGKEGLLMSMRSSVAPAF